MTSAVVNSDYAGGERWRCYCCCCSVELLPVMQQRGRLSLWRLPGVARAQNFARVGASSTPPWPESSPAPRGSGRQTSSTQATAAASTGPIAAPATLGNRYIIPDNAWKVLRCMLWRRSNEAGLAPGRCRLFADARRRIVEAEGLLAGGDRCPRSTAMARSDTDAAAGRKAQRRLLQAAGRLVPDRAALRSAFSIFSTVRIGLLDVRENEELHATRAGVAIDGDRERRHADPAQAHFDRVDAGAVEVNAVVEDRRRLPRRQIIYPVQQRSRRRRSLRADQRGDHVPRGDLQADDLDRDDLPYCHLQVRNVEDDGGAEIRRARSKLRRTRLNLRGIGVLLGSGELRVVTKRVPQPRGAARVHSGGEQLQGPEW